MGGLILCGCHGVPHPLGIWLEGANLGLGRTVWGEGEFPSASGNIFTCWAHPVGRYFCFLCTDEATRPEEGGWGQAEQEVLVLGHEEGVGLCAGGSARSQCPGGCQLPHRRPALLLSPP